MKFETGIFVWLCAAFIWAVAVEWWVQRQVSRMTRDTGAAAELRSYTEEQGSTSPVEAECSRPPGLPPTAPATHPGGRPDWDVYLLAWLIIGAFIWAFW